MHRIWQAVAIILGMVIVVLGGVTAYVFLARTANQPPRPTPTATATASVSPSTSSSPSAGASNGPTPSSGSSPGASPTPGPSTVGPTPSPIESAPPGPLGTVEFSVEKLGLDDPKLEGALARSITFTSNGSGEVRAAISDTTGGNVRMCLYKGSPSTTAATPVCRVGTKGFVRATASGTSGTWTVELSNTVSGKHPVTTATVTYRTRTPGLELDGFRFQGTADQQRNGFRVHLKARADGDVAVTGDWLLGDTIQAFDHRIRIRDVTDSADVVDAPANGESASGGGPVKAGHEYQVDLRNTQVDAGGEVSVSATVSWP
jgi:hypothetical protein